jgi:hypothetical protein
VEYPEVLLLFSNKAKVYRYSLEKIEESPVRSKDFCLTGSPLIPGKELLPRFPNEPAGMWYWPESMDLYAAFATTFLVSICALARP